MNLQELFEGYCCLNNNTEVTGLNLDSRTVKPGEVFFAVPGAKTHGLEFAGQAFERGAVAVAYDQAKNDQQLLQLKLHGLLIEVKDLMVNLGDIAARFYANPSDQMQIVGITGTNGKTSCSYFLAQVLERCAVIGTLGWGFLNDIKSTLNTTPDAIALQKILTELNHQGCDRVAMEASSHGLSQGRVNGVRFKGCVFTNFSRDHLDYHETMERYINSKLALLSKPGIEFVVLNLDDTQYGKVLAATPQGVKKWGFSTKGKEIKGINSVVAENIRLKSSGLGCCIRFSGQQTEVETGLFGNLNVENLLAIACVMLAMDISLETVGKKLRLLQPVEGRMQVVRTDRHATIVIDYAHTPDALQKALLSLRPHCNRQLKVLFGCGGDRDQGKRAEMGKVAEQYADQVVISNDNPRTEDPDKIIEDIKSGMKSDPYCVEKDRRQAIQTLISEAQEQDVLLIAGKGHETYQEINGKKQPFSDIETVKQILQR